MANVEELKQQFEEFRAGFDALRAEVAKVIVGHEEIVEGTLTALIAGGHVLLEGVPGLGKTLLVRTLADALQLKFSPHPVHARPDARRPDRHQRRAREPRGRPAVRVPGRPGLRQPRPGRRDQPGHAQDPVGPAGGDAGEVGHRRRQDVPPRPAVLRPGDPEPAGEEGTYPLPEAQLDRFFFKLLVRFPDAAEIEAILDRTTEGHDPKAEPVFDGERISQMGQLARQIPISDELRRYGIALVLATHPENEQATTMARQYVRYGSSPRGAQAIILAAKIRAILDHRFHVSRDDIQAVAPTALRHRLILNFEGQAENIRADDIIANALEAVEATAPAPWLTGGGSKPWIVGPAIRP